MDGVQKQEVLIEAKEHVKRVGDKIFSAKTALENSIVQLRTELIRARGEERDTKEAIFYFQIEKQHMLGDQHGSPYFFRCDVQFDSVSHRLGISTLFNKIRQTDTDAIIVSEIIKNPIKGDKLRRFKRC